MGTKLRVSSADVFGPFVDSMMYRYVFVQIVFFFHTAVKKTNTIQMEYICLRRLASGACIKEL